MTAIWTHRGEGPENTLLAFESAWQKGITHFETDLQLTGDNTLVLAHDASIYRLTGIRAKISDLTYQELQRYPIHGVSGWTKLSDLMHSYPGAHISIDLKSDKTTPALIDLLRRNKSWLPHLTIGSFNSDRVKTIRSALPSAITALTPREILKLKGVSTIALGQFNQVVAMIPLRINRLPLLTPKFRQRLNSHHIPVHAWTVNSEIDMKYCQDLAVDGIVTDEIDRALVTFTS